MPKKIQSNSQANVKPQASLGSRVFEALTETEISQLLDELFVVISDEQRASLFAKLQADTQATLTQILAPPQTVEREETAKTQPTSLAKLSQTWSELWREWNDIISEASQDEGKYIVQERHWEEPYFDILPTAIDCASEPKAITLSITFGLVKKAQFMNVQSII